MKRTLYLEQIKRHLRVQPICAILGARQVGKATFVNLSVNIRNMNIAVQDLQLDHFYIIFPGNISFAMSEKITACGLDALKEIDI